MLIIGITGNIGSGKSTVCRIFSSLGIPVYDADSAAKKLMNTNDTLRVQLKEAFGSGSFDENKLPDRKFLSKKVFSNPGELQKLNRLVHPAVQEDFETWVSSRTDAPYAIIEAAILFESGANKNCRKTIIVTAPAELRMQRAMRRDPITSEQFMMRENIQMNEDTKRRLADFEIINDEKQLVIPQVLKLHEMFRELAGKTQPVN